MYAGNAATIYKIERKIVMETMYVIEHNAVRVESSWLKQIRGKCIWVYYLKYTTRWHKNGTKRNYKFGWIKKSLEKAHLSVSCTAIGNWCFANVLNTFFLRKPKTFITFAAKKRQNDYENKTIYKRMFTERMKETRGMKIATCRHTNYQ